MGGLTASGGCRCREEARVGLARVTSVSGTGRRVRARGLALEGAAIFHVHAVLRSAARTLYDPSDSPLAGLEAAAATETAPHLPHPFPRPPPDRARLVPHPRLPARPPARYAAAMSAQAQMRAMLDQLMGTSRDGKSLPEPWGWGRGRCRGGGRPPREHLGARVRSSKGLPDW